MKKKNKELESEIELDPLSDDDLEMIDIGSDNDEEEEEKGIRINLHVILLATMAILVGMMIFYIIRWNGRTVKIDTSNIVEGQFDMENLDYYVHKDPDLLVNHPDDGENNILLIGNNILTNNGAEVSLANALADKLEANIYTLAIDTGKVASERPYPEGPVNPADAFSLPRIAEILVTGERDIQTNDLVYQHQDLFFSNSEQRALDYIHVLDGLDMDKIDTIIIMYSLADYYRAIPPLIIDQEQVNCYYGALHKAVKMLKDSFPHINVVLASPPPSYIYGSNNELILANLENYGFGNASYYVDLAYFVATECCVSYIDNYFYIITDQNITEYIDNFVLTEKGVDLIATHFANFFKTKPIGGQLPAASPSELSTENDTQQ